MFKFLPIMGVNGEGRIDYGKIAGYSAAGLAGLGVVAYVFGISYVLTEQTDKKWEYQIQRDIKDPNRIEIDFKVGSPKHSAEQEAYDAVYKRCEVTGKEPIVGKDVFLVVKDGECWGEIKINKER